MAHFNLYRQSSNWKVQFVRITDSLVWDNANSVLAAAPTWTDTTIALTYSAVIGGHPVTIPSTLPSGTYDMKFFDSATPAHTDDVQLTKRIQWENGILMPPIRKLIDSE